MLYCLIFVVAPINSQINCEFIDFFIEMYESDMNDSCTTKIITVFMTNGKKESFSKGIIIEIGLSTIMNIG